MAIKASDQITLHVLPSPSYVRQYYLLQSSSLGVPAKPTSNPPAAPWTTVEPAFNESTTNTLYTTMLTAYGSVAFEYGDVQKSSSYEAAKSAYNRAVASGQSADAAAAAANVAQAAAAGLIKAQAADPGHAPGRIWFPLDGNGKVIGMKLSNGTVWADYTLMAGQILVPGSVGTVQIADGAIVAPKITASSELSAKIAEFIQVKAGQLTWDNAVGNAAFVTSLLSQETFAEKMATNKLIVSPGQLLLDTKFNKAAWNSDSGTGAITISGLAPSGSPVLVIAAGTALRYGAYYGNKVEWRIPTEGNEKYVISMLVRSPSSIPASSLSVAIQQWNAAGSRTTATGTAHTSAIAANTWTRVTFEATTASTAAAFGVYLAVQAAATGAIWVADPRVERKVGGVLIEDGSITATKITATSELWTKVIGVAGNATIGGALLANESITAPKIVASEEFYAKFLQAQNLRVGTGVFNAAFADAIWANVIKARKITADMMLVGSGENLIPDPQFSIAEAWPGTQRQATGGRITGGSFLVPAASGVTGNYSLNTEVYSARIEPLTPYRVKVWVNPGAAVAKGNVRIYFREFTSGSWVTGTNPAERYITWDASVPDTLPASTWTECTGVVTSYSASKFTNVGFYVNGSYAVRFSDPSVTAMTDSSLIVDGGVQAKHLNVVSETTTRAMSIRPDGLRLWDKSAGEESPLVSLTSDSEQFFAIADSTGSVISSLDSAGNVVGKQMNATNSLSVSGQDVKMLINERPGRILASGKVNIGAIHMDPYKWYMPIRLDFTVPAGRMARLLGSGLKFQYGYGGIMFGYVTSWDTYSANGSLNPTPSINLSTPDPYLTARSSNEPYASSLTTSTFFGPDTVDKSYVVVFAIANDWSAATQIQGAMSVVVEDLGVADSFQFNSSHVGVLADAPSLTAPVVPPTKTYERTFSSSSWGSFYGTGAAVGSSSMYYNVVTQGQAPTGSGTQGAARGLWTFPSITSELSGATINAMEIYLTNQHTRWGAGATAYLFAHGYSSVPATLGASSSNQITQAFAKGQGLWITIPSSHFASWKSGAMRGYGLYTTGTDNYGYWAPAAQLWVKYTK